MTLSVGGKGPSLEGFIGVKQKNRGHSQVPGMYVCMYVYIFIDMYLYIYIILCTYYTHIPQMVPHHF